MNQLMTDRQAEESLSHERAGAFEKEWPHEQSGVRFVSQSNGVQRGEGFTTSVGE